jgi:hypothetical protein
MPFPSVGVRQNSVLLFTFEITTPKSPEDIFHKIRYKTVFYTMSLTALCVPPLIAR